MSSNSNVYPNDFKKTVTTGNTTDPGAALQAAISGVEVTARDTALRLVHQRRVAAQSIIANQNKIVRAFHKRMPPHAVGKAIAQPTILGTSVYINTRGLQVFNLLNEVFRRSSAVLPNHATYGAGVGNSESGKFVGGGDATGKFYDTIDKVFYLPREKVAGTVARLSEGRLAVIGQMGDKSRGVIAGGANSFGILKRDCHVYNHILDTLSVVANFLQRTRFAPHGGLSSKFAGYVLGGSDQYYAGSTINSIEKIEYLSTLANSRYISATSPHAHVVHASFGNDVIGCLAGGSNTTPPFAKWATNDITEFVFSTELASLSLTKLTNELACSFGSGSSEAGYIFSGWVDSSLSSLTNSGVFKYRYGDKQSFLIEQRLLSSAWDCVANSDYGAGFSYA